MRNAILYIRKSTNDKQANSFQIQLQAMRNYCEGVLNVTHIMQETGTGRTLDREKLQETFKLLKEDKTRVVVFYRVDRYGRTIDEFKPLRKFIDNNQVRFMDIQDAESKADMMLIQMKLILAEQESRLLGQRIAATHAYLALEGRGWGKSSEDMKEMRKKANKTIQKNADSFGEALYAYDILLEQVEGITTIQEKCDFLNKTGAVTPPRGGKFTPSSYYRVLKRIKARKHHERTKRKENDNQAG